MGGSLLGCPVALAKCLVAFAKLKGHGVGASLASRQCSVIVSQMVTAWPHSWFLKLLEQKAGMMKCFPVRRQRSMEPDEVNGEMPPWRIFLLSFLEVGRFPEVGNLGIVVAIGSFALRKTWV